MEHPLIGNINSLSEDQLHEKISELTKKYMIAQKMGNADLCKQIGMALETYRTKAQEKVRKGNDDNFDDKIDVS